MVTNRSRKGVGGRHALDWTMKVIKLVISCLNRHHNKQRLRWGWNDLITRICHPWEGSLSQVEPGVGESGKRKGKSGLVRSPRLNGGQTCQLFQPRSTSQVRLVEFHINFAVNLFVYLCYDVLVISSSSLSWAEIQLFVYMQDCVYPDGEANSSYFDHESVFYHTKLH